MFAETMQLKNIPVTTQLYTSSTDVDRRKSVINYSRVANGIKVYAVQ